MRGFHFRRYRQLKGLKVIESKTEDGISRAEEYLQRIEILAKDVRGWCAAHNLTVTEEPIILREMNVPEYEAPILRISKDNVALARLEPIASKVIGGEGRIDLIGRFARHLLLFRHPGDSGYPLPIMVYQRNRDPWDFPYSIATENGWYWTESRIRRQKPIHENLFLDLITDVSDHAF